MKKLLLVGVLLGFSSINALTTNILYQSGEGTAKQQCQKYCLNKFGTFSTGVSYTKGNKYMTCNCNSYSQGP